MNWPIVIDVSPARTAVNIRPKPVGTRHRAPLQQLAQTLNALRFRFVVESADSAAVHHVHCAGRGFHDRRDLWPGPGRVIAEEDDNSLASTEAALQLENDAGKFGLQGQLEGRRRRST